jgi:hypothetical protein
MTEAEWLECTDPRPMLEFLAGRSLRRERLFGCALCQGVRHLLKDRRAEQALEMAERFADSPVDPREWKRARALVNASLRDCDLSRRPTYYARCAVKHVTWESLPSLKLVQGNFRAALWCVSHRVGKRLPSHVGKTPLPEEAALLRDLYGNPFRSVALASEVLDWDEGAVVYLAQTIYAERAFDRLSELADALTEAGCAEEVILTHLRNPATHTRGSWVLDLILGKE